MGDNPDGYPRVFLREWGKGERELFEEYLNKLIESKNAVIFKRVMDNNFEHSSMSSAGSESKSDSDLSGSGSDDDSDAEDEAARKAKILAAFGDVAGGSTKKKKKKKKDEDEEGVQKGGKTKVKIVRAEAKIITKTVDRALVPIEQSGIVIELQILPGEDDAEKNAAL